MNGGAMKERVSTAYTWVPSKSKSLVSKTPKYGNSLFNQYITALMVGYIQAALENQGKV